VVVPLAGVSFSKDDIKVLSLQRNMSKAELLKAISQSSQSGRHYLPYSNADIAICVTISATRKLKDMNLKKSIISKTVK
jgi:hypothetical protein